MLESSRFFRKKKRAREGMKRPDFRGFTRIRDWFLLATPLLSFQLFQAGAFLLFVFVISWLLLLLPAGEVEGKSTLCPTGRFTV